MASWIIWIPVVVHEKWDEGPRVTHGKCNYISTARKHQKRLHVGVRLVHVCGCEAQQNRINRLMRMRRISRGGYWTGSSCTWLLNHPIFYPPRQHLWVRLWKNKTLVFLEEVNTWKLQWQTFEGGGGTSLLTTMNQGSQLFSHVVYFPPDAVFSQCP